MNDRQMDQHDAILRIRNNLPIKILIVDDEDSGSSAHIMGLVRSFTSSEVPWW